MIDRPDTDEWRDLLAVSQRLGQDITLIQAAGGNTSLKTGGQLWIKASGTWLADAGTSPIMVPVELRAMRARIMEGDLDESEIAGMTGAASGAEGMRASVETPFHALFDAPCVLHVHCVATLAQAIAVDAEARLAERLRGMAWHWQPYVKPGVPLTNTLRDAGAAGAEVIVLGNHGLIVAGESPLEAEARLQEVQTRLSVAAEDNPTDFRPLDLDLTGTGYRIAPVGQAHALAQDEALTALAENCAVAPDFVVFFGPRNPVIPGDGELRHALAALSREPVPMNSVVVIEGHGVLIREDAMRGTAELLRGYHLVLTQFLSSGGGRIRPLTPVETNELLDWDAEKYRQSLNSGGADAPQ